MRNNLSYVLFGAILLASCGSNSGGAKTPGTKDSTSATTTPAATSAADKGLELIGANDCTACHSIRVGQGPNTGPAYEDVAAKYSPAADSTVNRLVKKIITGGTGVWGANVMTPHPALSEADVKTMVTYILSIKKG